MDRELRRIDRDVEVRTHEDGSTTLSAYAAVFDSDSHDLGGFVERVAPGAFTKTLTEADVFALVDHDMSKILGRSTSGTLRMVQDNVGLRYEVDLPDTQTARDIAELVRRKDVRGSSFAFQAVKDSWEKRDDSDTPLRTLTEVRLYDVSVVSTPAYPATENDAVAPALRSLTEWRSKTTESSEKDDEPVETTRPPHNLRRAKLMQKRRPPASR